MSSRVYAVVALFDSARQLVDAIPVVRSRVAGHLDAYTPYPIHGIEETLGLRKSPIAGMVFVMGLVGAVSAMAFELWSAGVDYPLVAAGKPVLSWEAYVPIMFEVTVLFACFTAGLGMLLLLNRLPLLGHPMLRAKSMPLITKDKFALAVESNGRTLDIEAITAVLREVGASAVEVVEENPPLGPVSPRFVLRALLGITICCAAAGYLTYWAVKLFPVSAPMVHMLDQPRQNPQRESSFFADGAGMRLPVAGTVARGHMPYTVANPDEAARLANPLRPTADALEQGRQAFMTYCAVCHGVLGDGVGTLTPAYGAKPANLVTQRFREYSDGSIYHVIMVGKNAMSSYAADLSEDERWSVVHYVRVLQRALNASDEDVAEAISR